MSTYRATLRVGEKAYPVSTKAESRDEAIQRIAHVAATSFPNQGNIKIEFDPSRVGDEAMDFLKNIFGFK